MNKTSDEDTETSNSSVKSENNSTSCQDNPSSEAPPPPRPALRRPPQHHSNNRLSVRSTPAKDSPHPLATETNFDSNNDDGNDDNGTMYGIPEIDIEDDYLYPDPDGNNDDNNGITGRQQHGQNLTRASLSHADAKDRHEEFQSLLAESAALVDRMLGDPRPAMKLEELQQRPTDELQADTEDIPAYISRKSSTKLTHPLEQRPQRSGSVLGSLMRMEHQIQHTRSSSIKHEYETGKPKKKKDLTFEDDKIIKQKKDGKSIYNMPQFSKSAETIKGPKRPKMHTSKSWLSEIGKTTDTIKRPKRPKMHSSNSSWLGDMTKSKHLVPSLDKRKLQTNTPSRRSSKDSTMTRASQFEPISLEDRIRITFEIANILQKQTFLRKLIKCLMLYGCPAHRLEYIMREVSKTLNVQAEYVYLPNIMLLSFLDPDMHTTETHFVRQTQSFNMHKLGEIYRLEKLVAHGEVTVDEALEFIDKVTTERDFYPFWIVPFTYALASFCGCVMFYGGTWREAGLASALAVFFAIYEVFSGRLVSFQPIYEITCCIIVGFISRALGKFGFCFTPVAFASFIVLLPGYSMAISIVELVSRQLVCGVVRMVYAIIYSFLLGYGITMGSSLYATIDPSSMEQRSQCQRTEKASTCITTVPEAYYFLTVPLFAVAYCVYLRARVPRWPVMILLAVTGFVVNWALACRATAPSQVLQVVPAFAIGLLGNLYTKFTQKMSFDAVLLGVFYLVPGSLGLKSALGFFGTASGSEFSNQGGGFALSMIETSIGISIGLFVATLLVYPKGTAHTPLMNF